MNQFARSPLLSRFAVALTSVAACLVPFLCPAEEETTSQVVVTGRGGEYDDTLEERGGYGQPEWVDRNRASVTTKLYVLNPLETFVGIRSESDFLRHDGSVHDLTQEFEIGIWGRVELDLENQLGLADHRAGESEASVGARYALAAWDKLPLNPALSATWHFGTGSDLANRLEPARRGTTADSYELRLLVGQEFIPRLFWTANVFFQHDAASGHERQAGFAQDVSYLVLADRLTVGAEMRYTNATRRGSNRGSANEFLIGPSINLRSDFHSLFGLAALFGCTGDSPQVAILASVSFEFGGGESRKSKSPIANP